ncbi:ABC transporter permease subunit [Clostridium sp. MCC353]|uniref:carbohydrate ABC transporter permease n=1 Tax=Clostridium sp. MCC353 TaxID=2592646 RepID=UPI001C022867|nr:sugar ABC transporter permease [Clostridium sp. MCC353]MBT9779861.1 ABC transporter permease subunit [Clostridium sp. MCC353]
MSNFYSKNAKNIFPWLLILPTLVFLGMFCFFPMIRGFGYAVTNYDRGNPKATEFVGMANFVKIFTEDKVFVKTLVTSLKWVVSQVTLQLFFGMIFALILNQKFRGRGLVRTFCFAPWAVSGVLTTMLWVLIFNEHIGLLNNVLKAVGLSHMTKAWVQNVQTAFPSVVIAELWRGIPFFTITLLGGLQTVPLELYESAKVDGGNAWKNFWLITIPYMKESIVFATLMRTIWEFRSVDLIMTMTDGGPVRRTLTLPIYMYKTSIENGQYGYGAALTVILFLILSVYVVIYLKANNFGKGVNE